MDRLVSIFVCGAQKAGTTSFHAHLIEHAALSPPRRKEIHFFDNERLDWMTPDYYELAAFFPEPDGDRIRFDNTPIYGFWPPSIARIRDYNPAARLMFLFRDPLDRAFSQWCMEYSGGRETLPFSEAIREGRQRLDRRFPLAWEWRAFSYVERSLYAAQVRRALANFPRDNLLFLRSDELMNDHRATLARIAAFLDIAPFPDTGPKREHLGPEMPHGSAPSEADRRLFGNLVANDSREFAALTGLDISDWAIMR